MQRETDKTAKEDTRFGVLCGPGETRLKLSMSNREMLSKGKKAE